MSRRRVRVAVSQRKRMSLRPQKWKQNQVDGQNFMVSSFRPSCPGITSQAIRVNARPFGEQNYFKSNCCDFSLLFDGVRKIDSMSANSVNNFYSHADSDSGLFSSLIFNGGFEIPVGADL